MILKIKAIALWIGVLLFWLPIAGWADGEEGKETEVLEAGEVVVTATRTKRLVRDVPASVTVITREDIKKSRAQSADELLADVVGAFSRHSSGVVTGGHGQVVHLRGMGGGIQNRVMVLKDGAPLNDSFSGRVAWNEFDIQDIERIEVVRGAGSALYGSHAMGGVINIITRKPDKKVKTTMQGSYGSLTTWSGSLNSSGAIGRLGYRISGQGLGSEGYCINIKKPYYTDRDVKRRNLSGVLTYAIDSSSSITLSGSHFRDKYSGQYRISNYNPLTVFNDRFSLRYQKELERWNMGITFYGSDEDNSYDVAAGPTYKTLLNDRSGSTNTAGGMFQAGINLNNNHILTLGSEYKQGKIMRHDAYKTTTRMVETKGKQEYISFFLQDEISLFSKRLSITLGGRYDRWKSFDGYEYDTMAGPKLTQYAENAEDAFNPKVGVNYHLTGTTTLRAAIGKAFRAPSLSELYSTDIFGRIILRASPDLGPEELIFYEVRIDQELLEGKGLFKATYYYNDAEDFIYSVTTAPVIRGYITRDYKNVGQISMQGVEIEAGYRPYRDWSFFANYTFNRSKIREFKEDATLEGKYLTAIPKHKYDIGIVYDNPRIITARVVGRYVGYRFDDDKNTEKLDAYFTLGLKLSRRIGENIELGLEIDDLNNKTYREAYDRESPGSTVMFTVGATF